MWLQQPEENINQYWKPTKRAQHFENTAKTTKYRRIYDFFWDKEYTSEGIRAKLY
jgi:hypothetical protein